MKKRVIIGDLHGLQIWKDIVTKENPDVTIFLGDYFDSFTININKQYENFQDLLEWSNKYKFILLLGNHDYHYTLLAKEHYGGYSYEMHKLIGNQIDELIDKNKMQLAYVDWINKVIYSHAGVSQKWFDESCEDLSLINNVSFDYLKFTYHDGGDWYGSSVYSSPIWIRPEGLLKFSYRDNDGIVWHQTFGHTNRIQPIRNILEKAAFWDIDCLGQGWYILEKLDDKGKFIERKIKQI